MLSREYYYLGTQLPIDRFLTFYYAHPGFHINNMLVTLSVQVVIVSSKFFCSSRYVLQLTGPYSGILRNSELHAYHLCIHVVWAIDRCSSGMLQPRPRIPMDRALHSQYSLGLPDLVLASFPPRCVLFSSCSFACLIFSQNSRSVDYGKPSFGL
jgi:hypothetical protein